MIEEQGRIVALEEGFVWVETERRSSCSSCGVRQSCGQHLSEKYKAGASLSYIKASLSPEMDSHLLKAGDSVMVGIPENALLKASFLMYLFPLLLMLLVCWVGSLLGMSDALLSVTAVVSLLGSFWLIKSRSGQSDNLCQVVITRVSPKSERQPA